MEVSACLNFHSPDRKAFPNQHKRRQKDLWQIPSIALTAGAMQEEKERCPACGMNAVLTKPGRAEALSGALAQWFRP
jgi:CheY-like chemotaxis protein